MAVRVELRGPISKTVWFAQPPATGDLVEIDQHTFRVKTVGHAPSDVANDVDGSKAGYVALLRTKGRRRAQPAQ